jgi:hypothetical protein
MIEIRKAKKEDWEDIVKLSALSGLPFPDFDRLISASVVVKDDKVIAFGYIKTFVEAIFFPDKESKKSIAVSFRLLHEQMLKECKELGIPTITIFSENPSFTKILEDNFNYTPCKGDAIYREVEQ